MRILTWLLLASPPLRYPRRGARKQRRDCAHDQNKDGPRGTSAAPGVGYHKQSNLPHDGSIMEYLPRGANIHDIIRALQDSDDRLKVVEKQKMKFCFKRFISCKMGYFCHMIFKSLNIQ